MHNMWYIAKIFLYYDDDLTKPYEQAQRLIVVLQYIDVVDDKIIHVAVHSCSLLRHKTKLMCEYKFFIIKGYFSTFQKFCKETTGVLTGCAYLHRVHDKRAEDVWCCKMLRAIAFVILFDFVLCLARQSPGNDAKLLHFALKI